MRRAEKAERIGQILDRLYPTQPIPLNHGDPYTLLVAVMLSAQTTDKKVNQVTPQLFAKADTPEKMVQLEVGEIQQIIREIGLAPTKARNLKKMAQQLVERHDGEVLADSSGLPQPRFLRNPVRERQRESLRRRCARLDAQLL